VRNPRALLNWAHRSGQRINRPAADKGRSSPLRFARGIGSAFGVYIIVGGLIQLVLPTSWVKNLISNILILGSSITIGLGSALRRKYSSSANLLAAWLIIPFLLLPMILAILAGLFGLASPAIFGINGHYRVDKCQAFRAGTTCAGRFIDHQGKDLARAGIYFPRVSDSRSLQGSEIPAELFYENPTGKSIKITLRPTTPPPNVGLATTKCVLALTAWTILIVTVREGGRRRRCDTTAIWNLERTILSGKVLARTLFATGSLFAATGLTLSVGVIISDLATSDLTSLPHEVIGLGGADWLTLFGLGLALVGWGLPRLRILRLPVVWPRCFYLASLFYTLIILLLATVHFVGRSMTALVIPSETQHFVKLSQPIERLEVVFSAGLILANLAVACSLVPLALQLQGLHRPRPRTGRPTDYSLLRRAGALEFLVLLSRGTDDHKTAQSSLRHRLVDRDFSRLCHLLEERNLISEDAETLELTERGRRVAEGIEQAISDDPTPQR
jgi:hypothetical protein